MRQIDVHGNRGPEATAPLTISTIPACAAPTRWQAVMSPSAGRAGVSVRPLLTWRRIRADTALYGVRSTAATAALGYT